LRGRQDDVETLPDEGNDSEEGEQGEGDDSQGSENGSESDGFHEAELVEFLAGLQPLIVSFNPVKFQQGLL